MAADDVIIELGTRPPDGTESEAARRAPDRQARGRLIRLGAAFLAGLLLGGAGIWVSRDARERRADAATVRLVAFAAEASGGGMDATGVVRLDGQLELVNTGPAPVEVRSAEARRPGVLIRDVGRSRLLRPGGAGRLDVEVLIRCTAPSDAEPLSMRFSVVAADGRAREVRYPVALRGGVWDRAATQMCELLPGRTRSR
ncbi:hypothetical protein [Micromonospora siamensis]|uniref:Uncharacterized protein n=1 Tax=Micromonospora siamensis TaxID=299152 RepID=A0A1C5H5T2_9ACTN|nr:hypothetical protein [Micromonospora siamensis]SCG41402.1 hypothetical protein GA0074704_1119 [Micromonospora siamensis]